MVGASDRIGVVEDAVRPLEQALRHHGQHRPPCDGGVIHGDRRTRGVETQPQRLHSRRANGVEEGVVLAGQHHLDRALQCLGGRAAGTQ